MTTPSTPSDAGRLAELRAAAAEAQTARADLFKEMAALRVELAVTKIERDALTTERDTLKNQVQGLTDAMLRDNAREMAIRLRRTERERDIAYAALEGVARRAELLAAEVPNGAPFRFLANKAHAAVSAQKVMK